MTGSAIAHGLTCTFFNPTLRYHTGWETQMKRSRHPFRTQSLASNIYSQFAQLSQHVTSFADILPVHTLSLSLSMHLPLCICCFVPQKKSIVTSLHLENSDKRRLVRINDETHFPDSESCYKNYRLKKVLLTNHLKKFHFVLLRHEAVCALSSYVYCIVLFFKGETLWVGCHRAGWCVSLSHLKCGDG